MYKYLFFIIPLLIMKCVDSANSLETVKENGRIEKVSIKLSSPSGLKYLTITNSKELDSINVALKEMKEINVSIGGVFELWADITVFKNGKDADFMAQFSKYNGWMIVFGNRTFSNDYIFNLIEKYNKN